MKSVASRSLARGFFVWNSAEGSGKPVDEAIEAARERKIEDNLDQLLASRFGKLMVEPIKAIHLAEEGRPIKTAWDVTVAANALPVRCQTPTSVSISNAKPALS